jgi:broad specificity phosphatase PhoE
MKIYLIRHGRMAGDPHRYFEPPVTEGCLAEEGCRQARAMADALRNVKFQAVYASPLGRAIQTVQAVADRLSLPVQVLPWLEEWRPAHVLGKAPATDYESLLAAAAKLHPEETWKTAAGESTAQMVDRIVPGFLQLLRSHGIRAGHGGYLFDAADDQAPLALCGHGGSLGVLLAFLLGVPMQPCSPIQFLETGVAVIEFAKRVDVWYPLLQIPPPCSADATAKG